jgi:predicted site-specific integrase-resolvase
MTTTEVCMELGIHRNSLGAAVRNGEINPIDRLAKRYRDLGREVMRYWKYKTSQ